MSQVVRSTLTSVALAMGLVATAQAGLVNSSFENIVPGLTNAAPYFVQTAAVNTGWQTTAKDQLIEIWRQPGPLATAIPAYFGQQYAELNATEPSTLYQDSTGIAAGAIVGWQFAHRGREGVDTMRLTITDLGKDNAVGGAGVNADTVLFQNMFSDGMSWGFYSGTGLVALGNTVRFEFEAFAATPPPSGNCGPQGCLSYGNLLDVADFGVGVGVPEPGSLFLAGTALLALGAARRRRNQA